MSDAGSTLADFRRYAGMISAAMNVPLDRDIPLEGPAAVQVERGLLWARIVRDGPASATGPATAGWFDRLIDLAESQPLGSIVVVDRQGHHRPVYRSLLVYAWLQSYRVAYESLPREQFGRWEEGLRPWLDLLEADLGQLSWPDGAIPARGGAGAAEAAFTALALHVGGKVFVRDAWLDLASDAFGRLTRSQQSSGEFLVPDPADNPDAKTYDELTLLHAAAGYAVQAEDRHVAAAVARAGEFHLRQTQPDHATAQPWGLFAFIWNPDARSLGDQMLHTVLAHPPDGVSLLVLADALYSLRLFSK
jgi:hypothetical protein